MLLADRCSRYQWAGNGRSPSPAYVLYLAVEEPDSRSGIGVIHSRPWDMAEETMRGTERRRGELFSHVDLEHRVWQNHPLQPIRGMANAALAVLSHDFDKLYSRAGRSSIAPGMLLRAILL